MRWSRDEADGGGARNKSNGALTILQHRPTTTNISIKIDTTKEVDTDVETNLTFAQPEDLTPVSFDLSFRPSMPLAFECLYPTYFASLTPTQISYKAPESPAFGDRAIAKDDSREGSSDRSMV